MRTSTTVLFALVLAAASVAVRAEAAFDPAARANAVGPFINEQTFGVAHVDLSRIAIDALCDQIGVIFADLPEEVAKRRLEWGGMHQRLTAAGVKDIYVLLTLATEAHAIPQFAVLPEASENAEKGLREAFPDLALKRKGNALLIAINADVFAQTAAMATDPRPELVKAFEAAGDTAMQVIFAPPKHYRRVLEEAVGEFPGQLGGGSIRLLTQGMLWAAAETEPPPHAAVRLVVQSQDAPAAQAFQAKLVEIVQLASQAVRVSMPDFAQLATLWKPVVEGDRLVLALDEKTRDFTTLLVTGEIKSLVQADMRRQSIENLKQIALAMLNCESAEKHYPAPANYSPDGKPLLSWRVQILPYIEQSVLYNQFRPNEPWDSDHNRTLIAKMPLIYHPAISKHSRRTGLTNYLIPVGNGAAFTPGKPTEIKEITDGTSNTILVVEVDDDHAVPWTKPDDWQYDPKDPTKGLGHLFEGTFNTAFCDGSARVLRSAMKPKVLCNLFEKADGNAINVNDLQP